MIENQITTDPKLVSIFRFFNSLKINWFLSAESCLAYIRTGNPVVDNKVINLGIYGTAKDIQHKMTKFPIRRMIHYHKKVSEMTLLAGYQVNLSFFMDFYDFIIETRSMEEINRYRLLCYPPEIITDGCSTILFGNESFQILKNRMAYCKMLYGKNYLETTQEWDGWSDPANIIWEDFIQRPIRLI